MIGEITLNGMTENIKEASLKSAEDEFCRLCPRACNIQRNKTAGYCKIKNDIGTVRVAKAMLHFGEEPPITGKSGSGAVFFSGCNMRCVFCQNYEISGGGFGMDISVFRLAEIFLELQNKGAHNINLVTPTHFVPQVVYALKIIKDKLFIPVVFNCGGYEKVETLKRLSGLVDIYIPDIKFFDDRYSLRYSKAPGYFSTAAAALEEMLRQTGNYKIKDGLMVKGVIMRHLILPGLYKDSINIFNKMKQYKENLLISLMRQYYPCGDIEKFPEINRKLTTFEYHRVLEHCINLGFEGFIQEKSSATKEMTPRFDLSGVMAEG